MGFQIKINNYKSIQETEFSLKKGLNILIGPNGSGKTCLLSSLKFISDVIVRGAGLAIAKNGGPSRNYNRGANKIKFEIEFDYGERVFKRRKRDTKCKWELVIMQVGEDSISEIVFERIRIETTYESKKINLLNLEINRYNQSRRKTKLYIDRKNVGKDILNRFDAQNKRKGDLFNKIENHFKEILLKLKKQGDKSLISLLLRFDKVIAEFFFSFSTLNEYNIIPENARESTEQIPNVKMNTNGYGVSEVIAALKKGNYNKLRYSGFSELQAEIPFWYFDHYYHHYSPFRNKDKRKSLENALSNINRELSSAVNPIENVDIEIDPTNGRRFVVFNSEDHKFYPDEVSDGTIKWLCILTSIYVGFSKIFLLEEPENFLHPWMQQKLIQIMREQSKNDNTIFILTSHSTTLLNGAFPNELLLVKQGEGGTKVKRIEEEDEINNFLAESEFGLGDLWVSGGIGAVPE